MRSVFPEQFISEFDLVPYITRDQIDGELDHLAAELTGAYAQMNPIFLGTLNGAYIYAADLLRRLDFPHELEFAKLSSYDGLESQGEIEESYISDKVTNRHVIILEDIVDTGRTVDYLVDRLTQKGSLSTKICTLLLKPDVYHSQIKLDHVGFKIENQFVVGYGLDYMGYGRNLPEIYQLIPKKMA